MVRLVNLYEAKTHLSRLVEDAAGGEEIVIAKNGKPVAKLSAAVEEPAPAKRELGQWAHLKDPHDSRTREQWWRDWKALDAEIEREFEQGLEEDGREYDRWPATSSIPASSSGRKKSRKGSGKKRFAPSPRRRTSSS